LEVANLTIPELISRLKARDLPILATTAAELARQAALGEAASASDIAEIILHDPFCTLNVLREIGSRKRSRLSSEITTIEHAVMMFGAKPFFARFAKPQILEAHFQKNPQALLALRRVLSQSHHAACQARDWAILRQDMESEEVYIAASLNNLAEQCLCLLAPDIAVTLTDAIRRDPDGTREAQHALLGFDLRTFFDAIAQSFNFPELLQHLTDSNHLDEPRVLNVQLANSVARHTEFGWYGKALEVDVAAIAVLLHLAPDEVIGHIHRTGALAARAWRWYAVPPAARWLPLLPAMPATTPAAQFSSTSEVMAWVMRALQDEAGVSRGVFALLSTDGRNLRATMVFGGEAGSSFKQFEINLQQPHLFTQLLKKPQSIWFDAQSSAQTRSTLTPELIHVIGDGAFFASSVFIHAAPLGILYADHRGNNLDAAGYQAFKNISTKVTQALLLLGNKPK
jgi:HD-like signal output (HDOD) protein